MGKKTAKGKLLATVIMSAIFHSMFIKLYFVIDQHREWEMTRAFLFMYGLFYLSLCFATGAAIRDCFKEKSKLGNVLHKANKLLLGAAIIVGSWPQFPEYPFRGAMNIGLTIIACLLLGQIFNWLLGRVARLTKKLKP